MVIFLTTNNIKVFIHSLLLIMRPKTTKRKHLMNLLKTLLFLPLLANTSFAQTPLECFEMEGTTVTDYLCDEKEVIIPLGVPIYKRAL